MAIDRVRTRVTEGGPNRPETVIILRYFSGIRNVFDLYIDIVDQLIVFDSSDTLPKTIAFKSKGTDFTVNHAEKYNKLKVIYHGS